MQYLSLKIGAANTKTLLYTDFTVASGESYRYLLRKIDNNKYRSDSLDTEILIVFFEHSYLFYNDR
jgi:hypothetical protein